MAETHRAKRINEKTVEYRGHSIRRRDSVPTGYWGRYTMIAGPSFTTLREAKAWVDQKVGKS